MLFQKSNDKTILKLANEHFSVVLKENSHIFLIKINYNYDYYTQIKYKINISAINDIELFNLFIQIKSKLFHFIMFFFAMIFN